MCARYFLAVVDDFGFGFDELSDFLLDEESDFLSLLAEEESPDDESLGELDEESLDDESLDDESLDDESLDELDDEPERLSFL